MWPDFPILVSLVGLSGGFGFQIQIDFHEVEIMVSNLKSDGLSDAFYLRYKSYLFPMGLDSHTRL